MKFDFKYMTLLQQIIYFLLEIKLSDIMKPSFSLKCIKPKYGIQIVLILVKFECNF